MISPRLGSVPYLNARPLLHDLEAEWEVPSVLARRFLAGHFDAALLPVFDTLRLPCPRIVDGFGIGSCGAVHSVIVAHQNPLEETREIILDPASRTSAHLLQILLSGYFKLPVRLVEKSTDLAAARLIIGDPAIRFQKDKDPSWCILDLGQAWHDWTGLPFVFAAWTLAETAPVGTSDFLRAAARRGLDGLSAIAAEESDPGAAFDYLSRSIHYPMGPREREGILHFRRLLISTGLLDAGAPMPIFS